MRFLLDENFPVSAVTLIRQSGHEAFPFLESCSSGADDEQVFQTAQRLEAVILTSDRDFYHTIPLLHPIHHGIVVLSLRQPNRHNILSRLRWFLETIVAPIDNKVFALRDQTYCVR